MYPKDMELFEIANEFASVIEVAPPRTLDIIQWWDDALNEMSDFFVFALTANGAFTDNEGKKTNEMRKRLVQEATKRQHIYALAGILN